MNPKITLAMLMCGIGAVAAAGMASAATPDLDAPSHCGEVQPRDPRLLTTAHASSMPASRMQPSRFARATNRTLSALRSRCAASTPSKAPWRKCTTQRLAAVYLSATKRG